MILATIKFLVTTNSGKITQDQKPAKKTEPEVIEKPTPPVGKESLTELQRHFQGADPGNPPATKGSTSLIKPIKDTSLPQKAKEALDASDIYDTATLKTIGTKELRKRLRIRGKKTIKTILAFRSYLLQQDIHLTETTSDPNGRENYHCTLN